MRISPILLVALFSCLAGAVSAAPITFKVTVNTSAISGTGGALDFNFNPGPLLTQSASLQIIGFASNGTLADCAANLQGFCATGGAAGQLPATLTFTNAGAFNDYFDGFMFGSTLSFQVSLFGPALSAPDGVSTSGSAFAFSMFSDGAGTTPALTSDTTNGFALTVGVNLDGTTTLTNSSSQTTVTQAASGVPEPCSAVLMGAALAVVSLAMLGHRRERRRALQFDPGA